MEFQPNTLFNDRYRLIREISRGSFGEVWLAKDERLDLEVAIKVYIALDNRGIEEFKSEYKVAYTLNHPNLLRAHYFDVCENRPFLVMPFCPSSAVAIIGQTDEQTAWRFISDVAAGLEYLHEQNIVHRDIKPDNILRDAEGHFLITDFGISMRMRSTLRRNSTRKHESTAAGTIGYMAPELFSANPDAVKATDVWAFGAALYEMLVGELPFMGQGGVMQLHGAEVPALKGDFSQCLKDTLSACLAKETWDRPTAAQLHEYAKAMLNGENPPAPWIKPASGPKRKKEDKKNTSAAHHSADPNATVGYTPHSDDTNAGEPVQRKRNWFVNVWIWFIIVTSILCTAIYCVAVISNYEYIGEFRIAAICSVLSAVAGWMMWKYNRLGIWLYFVAQWLSCVAMLKPNNIEPTGMHAIGYIIGYIIGLLVVLGIFQIRRNRVSAWKLMDYGIRVKGIYVVSSLAGIAAVVALVIPSGSAMDAKEHYGNYMQSVSESREILSQEKPSAESLIEAKKLITGIVLDDIIYGDVNRKYCEGVELRKKLNDVAEPVAEQWATAAKSQERIGNSDKAAEFWSTAVQLDENYRPDFEKAAEKFAYMKPVSLELKADDGSWGGTLQNARQIKWIYPRLRYETLDPDVSHELQLTIKVYNRGTMLGSYTVDVNITDSDSWIYLSGWGNKNGGVYSPGSLRVEVWYKDQKLISKSTTLY